MIIILVEHTGNYPLFPLIRQSFSGNAKFPVKQLETSLMSDVIVPILGVIIATMLNASPYNSVAQSLNSNEMLTNPIPLVVMFLNCISWWLYGLYTRNIFVLLPNGVGLVLGSYFVAVSFKLAFTQRLIRILMAGILFLFTTSSFGFLFQNQDAVGISCQVMLIGMYSSPLSLLFHIFKTKSSKGLNLSLSIMSLLNGMLWTAYGLMIKDPYQYVSNGLGIIMATIQLAVYFMYRNEKEEALHAEPLSADRLIAKGPYSIV
eukprot:NODE_190_length_15503_cov_0.365814.p4 type:complete len:261 gc:universal NODE_190_length_15503_cov_0.365814:12336-11554(-)